MSKQVLTPAQLSQALNGEARRCETLSLKPLMETLSFAMAAAAKRNIDEGVTPAGVPFAPLRFGRIQGGNRPLHRFGLLAASLAPGGRGNIRRSSENVAEAGTNLAYAGIHQFGGVIEPSGKMLAIPLTREAQRFNPRKAPAFPRQLFVIPPKKGRKHPLLAESKLVGRGKNKRRKIILHYMLVASVEVPARPFLGFGPRLNELVRRIVADYMEKARRDGFRRPAPGTNGGPS